MGEALDLLNFLVPKLPAPEEEDLSKGILDAIDLDSSRVEKQAMQKIPLPDEDAEIGPIPTSAGGHRAEPELDRLSNRAIQAVHGQRRLQALADRHRILARLRAGRHSPKQGFTWRSPLKQVRRCTRCTVAEALRQYWILREPGLERCSGAPDDTQVSPAREFAASIAEMPRNRIG